MKVKFKRKKSAMTNWLKYSIWLNITLLLISLVLIFF